MNGNLFQFDEYQQQEQQLQQSMNMNTTTVNGKIIYF